MRKLNCFLLTAALICSAGTVTALEVTSNNDIRKLNSGLEQRLETTKSALTAAFNGLKGTIDDILARLGVLEADMVAVKAKNTEQDNRLNAIETSNQVRDQNINAIRTTQPVTWNTVLENRLRALESAGTGGVPVPDYTNCSKIETSSTKDRMIECPAGRVLVGLANGGLAVSSKNVYVGGKCCTMKLQ